MKRLGYLTCAVSLALLVSGCTKINLSGKPGTTGGGQPGLNLPGASLLGGGEKSPATVDGDWRISFDYQGQTYESTVTLSQQGKTVVGQGKDSATGVPFMVEQGSIDGNKIHFVKKYADNDPSKPTIDYTGDLTQLNEPDYKGWMMGGHYKTTVSGQPYDDKWAATSIAAEQAAAAAAQQQEQQAQQAPPAPEAQPEQSGGGEQAQAPGEEGPDISGHWSATYTFNFKKIFAKLWLEQDGHNVRGHGVDTNTNEQFTIAKGFYTYPKFQLNFKYVKGKSAAANRDLIVKGTVSKGLTMKGETNFGGAWEAKVVR